MGEASRPLKAIQTMSFHLDKMLENANSSLAAGNSCHGARVGCVREEQVQKGLGKPWGDGSVHYLGGSGGFMSVYIYVNTYQMVYLKYT